MTPFHKLASFTAVVTLAVIMLGAYVRLTDAGLGCPDWPGCYGQLLGVPEQVPEWAQSMPSARPLDVGKAWREVAHRYLAGFLGLLIFALAALAVARRREPGRRPWLALVLASVVVAQALLGMWTVTLLLQPLVVVAHLLGGFTVLALLWWLCLDRWFAPRAPRAKPPFLRVAALLGLALLGGQIALGGWTSANYAALACGDFPLCNGQWWPAARADFGEGFRLPRAGMDYEYGTLASPARVAVHFSHRLGALVVTVYLACLLATAFVFAPSLCRGAVRKAAVVAALLLGTQVVLGVSNVVYQLPLAAAVAHNGVAALLFLALLTLVRVLQSPTTIE